MLIRPFEEIKNGTREFLDTVLSFAAGKDSRDIEIRVLNSSNPSMSEKGVNLALDLYPLANNKDRKEISHFIFKYLSSSQFGKANFMDDLTSRAIIDRNRDSNRELFRRYISHLDESYYG